MKIPIYRNVKARDQLDIFLISAITSLLGVRFYLELTGYPQIASGGLHIAHMLWGGFLMMAAIVVSVSFLGLRAQQVSALVGGIGFGVFIDELGKFITKDNNYFFQPTIGLIYAIFVILYLLFNFLTRDEHLTSREYQLNALMQLEQALAYDMDPAEKRQVYGLIAKADQRSKITKELKRLLDSIDVSAEERYGRVHRFLRGVDHAYERFWKQKRSSQIVQSFFVIQAVAVLVSVLATSYSNVNDVKFLFDTNVSYGDELIVGQVVASTIALLFVLYGLNKMRYSRLLAFEQFRRSALINLYLTQFFVFSRLQFDALPGFIGNLAILLLIGFILREERRLEGTR